MLVLFLMGVGGRLHANEKLRVIVSTDIGGSDPDDFQSMVHYLLCADVFETEGLISSPPHKGRVRDILECITAYEKDYVNLRTWSRDYPTPDALRDVTRQGAVDPQLSDEPAAKISAGAKLIIARAHAKDRRPVYVLVWGSITDVAQAVHADPSIKTRLRIYSIGSWNTRQDPKARNYLFDKHPDLWWIESDTTFRGMYQGGFQDGDLGNRSFPDKHVKGHGHLGSLFMRKKADIKMGDTPSVLYLLHGDPGRPETDHWGGAFVRPFPDTRPTYWHDSPDKLLSDRGKDGAKTVNRWRRDYLADWKARMDRDLAKKPTADETFTLHPIGSVLKEDGRTYIVLEKQYEPGLMGLEQFSHVTVVYWFHLNDTPEKRAVLQVHPQGNRANPMRGVFATHSPVRPNLIAISRCKILSVRDNVIEIDNIDAFADTPVLDLKN